MTGVQLHRCPSHVCLHAHVKKEAGWDLLHLESCSIKAEYDSFNYVINYDTCYNYIITAGGRHHLSNTWWASSFLNSVCETKRWKMKMEERREAKASLHLHYKSMSVCVCLQLWRDIWMSSNQRKCSCKYFDQFHHQLDFWWLENRRIRIQFFRIDRNIQRWMDGQTGR